MGNEKMTISDSLKRLYAQVCEDGRQIDIEGYGAGILGFGPDQEPDKLATDSVFRYELSRFLLFVADGNGVLTEDERELIRFALGGIMELETFVQKYSEEGPIEPADVVSIMAFATGDVFRDDEHSKKVIPAFEQFGEAILTCDPDPSSRKRFSDFIQGLQSLKAEQQDKGNVFRILTKLRQTLKLGEALDETGEAGAKILTNGKMTSRGLVRFELARFLCYIAEDKSRLNEDAENLIRWAYGCDKDDPKLGLLSEMSDELKGYENMALIAYTFGDTVVTRREGETNTSFSVILINLFIEFGVRMLALTDYPDAGQQHYERGWNYISEMEDYAKQNIPQVTASSGTNGSDGSAHFASRETKQLAASGSGCMVSLLTFLLLLLLLVLL